MIIDDSITLKGNALPETAAAATVTTDCIDRVAAGTCMTHKPTFVCYVVPKTTAPAITAGTVATFTLLTCDTENGSYTPVTAVYSTVNKTAGVIAKLDLPVEGVKRFIKFSLSFNANVTANDGTFEVLTVPGTERGL